MTPRCTIKYLAPDLSTRAFPSCTSKRGFSTLGPYFDGELLGVKKVDDSPFPVWLEWTNFSFTDPSYVVGRTSFHLGASSPGESTSTIFIKIHCEQLVNKWETVRVMLREDDLREGLRTVFGKRDSLWLPRPLIRSSSGSTSRFSGLNFCQNWGLLSVN